MMSANQWITRLDQYFGQKDRYFFNYYNNLSRAQSANPRPAQRIVQPNYGMYGKGNLSHTITPALVNEASTTLVRVFCATPPTPPPVLPSLNLTGMQSVIQSQSGFGTPDRHLNYS